MEATALETNMEPENDGNPRCKSPFCQGSIVEVSS